MARSRAKVAAKRKKMSSRSRTRSNSPSPTRNPITSTKSLISEPESTLSGVVPAPTPTTLSILPELIAALNLLSVPISIGEDGLLQAATGGGGGGYPRPLYPARPGFGGGGGFPPEDDIQPEPIDLNLGLEKLGGLEEQIDYITRHIIQPMSSNSGTITGLASMIMKPIKGVIFYGPPGTGKTMLAKSMAATLSRKGTKFNFFMRRGTDVYSKWIGESERKLRSLFSKAEKMKPSIIFFDEIDGLCPSRKDDAHHHTTSVVTTLLGLMDAVKPGEVFVIGCTNRIDSLDPAFLRPGRFDKHLRFAAPNQRGRTQILRIKFNDWKWENSKLPSDEMLTELAESTVGFTGADLEKLIQTAVDYAVDRQFPQFGKGGHGPCSEDLSKLIVIRSDWLKALRTTKRTNVNVFGNSSYAGKILKPEFRPLLQGIVEEIKKGVLDFMSELGTCHGIKSYLVWTPTDPGVLIVDKLIIPSVIGLCDTGKKPAFLLSLDQPNNIMGVLNQAMSSSKEKPTFLVIPRIDQMWTWLREKNCADMITNFLEEGRGENLLVLASAVCDRPNLPEPLRNVFRGQDRSHRIRKVKDSELRAYFSPLFDSKSEYHKDEKSRHSALKCFLDKVVNLTRDDPIQDIMTLHGELDLDYSRYADSRTRMTHAALMTNLSETLELYEKNKLR